jgi:hypothetical protein
MNYHREPKSVDLGRNRAAAQAEVVDPITNPLGALGFTRFIVTCHVHISESE